MFTNADSLIDILPTFASEQKPGQLAIDLNKSFYRLIIKLELNCDWNMGFKIKSGCMFFIFDFIIDNKTEEREKGRKKAQHY